MWLERFDVIVVPFPFTDLPVTRRRPAVVVSGPEWQSATDQVVAAMITTARRSAWPLDVPLQDLAAAGLAQPCCVRMKIFTMEMLLVQRVIGHLSAADADPVGAALQSLLLG